MANRDLLKEAIADAKALKETAIANAKVALEEAFEPRLKSMLSAKLEEMDKEDELEEATTTEAKKEYKDDDRKDGGESKETKRTEKMKYGKDLAESEVDEDLNLDEILAELEKDDDTSSEKLKEAESDEDAEEEGYEDGIKDAKADAKKDLKELNDTKEELKEAYTAVNALKNELNEINVLNAKLLYTNKIFKSKNLSENNKVKVLTSFDKAETVKEAKLIYETLKDGLVNRKTNKSMNESIGMASKSAGIGPKKIKSTPIVESNEMVNRFKKLAGIIK